MNYDNNVRDPCRMYNIFTILNIVKIFEISFVIFKVIDIIKIIIYKLRSTKIVFPRVIEHHIGTKKNFLTKFPNITATKSNIGNLSVYI